MNKIDQRNLMNQFIERIKSIVKNDFALLNDQNRLSNIIYTQLISFNLGKNQAPFTNTEHLFNYWIDRNRDKPNLRTFVSPHYPYFCQFVNMNARNIADVAIKLYIPLDENHLYEGANRLFDFIDKQGISHNSKIGKKIRNDNIVVRTSNIEEAEKIIAFVNSDPYIKEGLLNTNPFTLNVNGVGIAKDGRYSYNSKICEAISGAITTFYNSNRLDDLNIDTFETYINQFDVSNDPNLKVIYDILKANISRKEFDFEDFKQIIATKSKLESKEEILKNAIIETGKKYSVQHLVNALERFRHNGDLSGFTRTNGARMKLFELNLYDLEEILSKANIKSSNFLEGYVQQALGIDKIKYLLEAYTVTTLKYGADQANRAMYNYIVKGNAGYFTNDRNARVNLLKNINYSNLRSLLLTYLNLDEYCSQEELYNYMIEHISKGRRIENNTLPKYG